MAAWLISLRDQPTIMHTMSIPRGAKQ